MSVMLTKRDAGKANVKRKFAQTRRLVPIEGIALASQVTDREDKEDGSPASVCRSKAVAIAIAASA